MPKDAQQRARQELKKLKMMPPMSAEATVVRNYIDWILALPWSDLSEDNLDIDHAEQVLDEDHYGLKKPKERIIEYLAVQALVKAPKGPILCLVGPPGVGKTSLAKSVARAMGRKFVRHVAGRRARRGRDPRPPPHVHRRDAGQAHPLAQEAPAPPTPSSCSTRSTRCRCRLPR
jgi:ATP-dependent Lon protease